MRTLARRIVFPDKEVDDLDAAQFLITAGQNIDRPHSEAAFARLCGVAPIPVSSGKTHRMRLHRGGDRRANRALYLVYVCGMRHDQCTEGYIAREVFHELRTDLTTP